MIKEVGSYIFRNDNNEESRRGLRVEIKEGEGTV